MSGADTPPPALRAAPGALATLCTGGPALLLLGGIEAAALDLPGIALWRAAAAPDAPGALCLHAAADPAPAATLPLPALPAGVLGILAAADPEPLLAAWAGLAPPPVVRAASAAEALPGLARLLAGALAARQVEAGRLLAGQALLREEAEETRIAMARLVQGIGDEPPAAPLLAIAATPDPACRAEAEEGGLVLAQRLGCSLEGISAIGLHLAAVAAPGPLRVRLLGEESGRVRAAWHVPPDDIAPGWLALELPTPLGPLRETAMLEVVAEAGLGLSLEAAEAPPELCPTVAAGAAPPGRALALRVWTAPFGRRAVLAPWWDWEAADLPPALAQRLPEQVWAAARVVAGRGQALALGEEGPLRPQVALAPGEAPALLLLPAIPTAGVDLVEAEVAVRLGEAGALEAALWLQPAGLPLAGMGDLSLTRPGARSTGWRRADAARGAITLALRLPPGPGGALAVALALRHAGAPSAEAAPLQVEWAGLLGRRLGADLPPAAARPSPGASPGPSLGAGVPPAATFLAAVPPSAVPALDPGGAVRLQEAFAMPGGGYRHLDMVVEGLRLGALVWPRLRFKFAVNGGAPQIEVRARPDWPVLFERWPGTAADEHGPFFLVTEADAGGRAMERLRAERDRRVLDALLRLLPTLVATAARAATADAAAYAEWVAMARRLAAALLEGEAGGG